jgi:hypothetical protein
MALYNAELIVWPVSKAQGKKSWSEGSENITLNSVQEEKVDEVSTAREEWCLFEAQRMSWVLTSTDEGIQDAIG